jgi:hypothetical protein
MNDRRSRMKPSGAPGRWPKRFTTGVIHRRSRARCITTPPTSSPAGPAPTNPSRGSAITSFTDSTGVRGRLRKRYRQARASATTPTATRVIVAALQAASTAAPCAAVQGSDRAGNRVVMSVGAWVRSGRQWVISSGRAAPLGRRGYACAVTKIPGFPQSTRCENDCNRAVYGAHGSGQSAVKTFMFQWFSSRLSF